MIVRAASVLLALLMVTQPVGAAPEPVTGPLATPARVKTAVAVANRLTAVTRQGERVIAVGPRGHILLSTDGGESWQQVPVPVSSDLVAVSFPDAGNGWAVGHDGVVLHSADGGASWQKQLDGHQAADIISAFLAEQGDALSEDVMFEAQRFVDEGADKPFLDVHFTSPSEGFVVGAFNLAFHTLDGGAHWQPLLGRIDNPMGYHLYALAEDGGQLWLAGEKGLLLRWEQAAQRFAAVESPYSGSYFGVIAHADMVVAFGLRGNVWASHDQGVTWQRLESGGNDAITAGTFLDDGRFVLVSQGGRVLVSDRQGSALSPLSVPQPMSYTGVAAAGEARVVLTGSDGVRGLTLGGQ